MVELLHIFTVDEIHSVGVDNARVVRLTLNFEVVGYQVDGPSGIHGMGRLEG